MKAEVYDVEEGSADTADQSNAFPIDLLSDGSDGLFEVEVIKDHRCSRSFSTIEYLIKWEGYDEETWEPESNIQAPDRLREYWEGQPGGIEAWQHAKGRKRSFTQENRNADWRAREKEERRIKVRQERLEIMCGLSVVDWTKEVEEGGGGGLGNIVRERWRAKETGGSLKLPSDTDLGNSHLEPPSLESSVQRLAVGAFQEDNVESEPCMSSTAGSAIQRPSELSSSTDIISLPSSPSSQMSTEPDSEPARRRSLREARPREVKSHPEPGSATPDLPSIRTPKLELSQDASRGKRVTAATERRVMAHQHCRRTRSMNLGAAAISSATRDSGPWLDGLVQAVALESGRSLQSRGVPGTCGPRQRELRSAAGGQAEFAGTGEEITEEQR